MPYNKELNVSKFMNFRCDNQHDVQNSYLDSNYDFKESKDKIHPAGLDCAWKSIYDFINCSEHFSDINSKLFIYDQLNKYYEQNQKS